MTRLQQSRGLQFLGEWGFFAGKCSLSCPTSPCSLGGGTPYNGLYGEAPPERGTFFRLQVYKRVGVLQVEAYKMVEKSVIYVVVFKMAFNYNISNRRPLWLYQFIY